jgi:hypothetical protein
VSELPDARLVILEEDAPRVFLASFTSTGTEGKKIDITWFAPTDKAFAAVPQDTLTYLLDRGDEGRDPRDRRAHDSCLGVDYVSR